MTTNERPTRAAGTYSELLADLDYYGDDRHVATPAEQRRRVRRAAAALRAVIAERGDDEAEPLSMDGADPFNEETNQI
jgi:hypothetical protein